jgi:hypothetical protein
VVRIRLGKGRTRQDHESGDGDQAEMDLHDTIPFIV